MRVSRISRYNMEHSNSPSTSSTVSVWGDGETLLHNINDQPPPTLVRTQLLLLDYKQFKAARLIQKTIRGWLVRRIMERRQNAARVIQRAWWMFKGVRYRTAMAQEMLQTNIEKCFNNSSLKIQKMYRGWHSRKFINNMLYLKNTQIKALQDIIRTMVYKMHSFSERNQLPGLLSFRDKNCLYKIESFLNTLSYRLYNRHVGNRLESLNTNRQMRRKEFLDSILYTQVPFYSGIETSAKMLYENRWEPTFKLYNSKQWDFAQAFTKHLNETERVRNDSRPSSIEIKEMRQRTLFCEDLMYSIKRWGLFGNNGSQEEIDGLLVENIIEYLEAVKSVLESKNYLKNCYCDRDTKPDQCLDEII